MKQNRNTMGRKGKRERLTVKRPVREGESSGGPATSRLSGSGYMV
jgi:hypothetical protein